MSEFVDWNRSKWEQKNRMVYRRFGRNCFAWHYAGLDSDVHNCLIEHSISKEATVLDLGTCSGSQAIGLAIMGYNVTGTDVSQTALDKAEETAQAYIGLKLRFVNDDILDSQFEAESFDVIFDRGCFHSIYGWIDNQQYIDAVHNLLKPGGLLVLKTMSESEKRFRQTDTRDGQTREMPHHFQKSELDELFAPSFDYLEMRESAFQSSVVHPDPIAWLVIVQKKA